MKMHNFRQKYEEFSDKTITESFRNSKTSIDFKIRNRISSISENNEYGMRQKSGLFSAFF